MQRSMSFYSVFPDCHIGTLKYERTEEEAAKKSKCPIETIVILDISGSMGSNVPRLAEKILPRAFEQAGYSKTDPITLITFETTSKIYQTTVEGIAKLGLVSESSTNMANAINYLGSTIRSLKPDAPVRLLTISDGQLGDQDLTVQTSSSLAPLFVERAVNSQAIRYFTGRCDPDTRGLASVLQFGTTDVKDAGRSGLIDICSDVTSDEELCKLIAELYKDDGVDCEAYLKSPEDCIQVVPWSSQFYSKVRLAFGDNVFWFKAVPSNLEINGVPVQTEDAGQLTFENFKIIDSKLQTMGFKIKSLQVVNSEAAEAEIKLAKIFFNKFFSALEATLPAESQDAQAVAEYKKRLIAYKDRVRRHFKGQAAQFNQIFNTKVGVSVMNSSQQACYMQNASPLKQAKIMKSKSSSMNPSRNMNCSNAGPSNYVGNFSNLSNVSNVQFYQMPIQQQQQQSIPMPQSASKQKSSGGFLQRLLPSSWFSNKHQKRAPKYPNSNNVQQLFILQESTPDAELDEIDIAVILHEEVKAMADHLSELDGIDDSDHRTSFFSYATTLQGIKAVCELQADEQLFETFDAMEILQLINIVGIACHGPIGKFEEPSFWKVSKIFPGCYISISDLLVASKQSGDRAYLTVPQTDEKITAVIPYFEDIRMKQFMEKYAPKLLEFSCSIGMRNKVTDVPDTYKQTQAAGIWKLAQELAGEQKLEVAITSFSLLVNSFLTEPSSNLVDLLKVSDESPATMFFLGYNGIQRLMIALIQMASEKTLKSSPNLCRILRALYAHEKFIALKLATAKDATLTAKHIFKNITNWEIDDAELAKLNDLIAHCDAIAALPDLLEVTLSGGDVVGKIKTLPKLTGESLAKTFGITYDFKLFKCFNIIQAFAFESKAKRLNQSIPGQMAIADLAALDVAEKMANDYLQA